MDRLLQLGPGVLQVKLLCDVPVLSYFQSLSLLRLPLSPGVVWTFLGSIFFDIIKVQIVDFHTVHRTAKLFSQLIRNLVLADQTGLYFLHFLPDDCSESVGVQCQEGVVGVFLSSLRDGQKLLSTELLQLWAECEVLLVELLLLSSGQSLPRCGVRKRRQSELLVLQLLGDGQSLSGRQDQRVSVAEVNITEVTNQSLPLFA